jgi:hypothetical protein
VEGGGTIVFFAPRTDVTEENHRVSCLRYEIQTYDFPNVNQKC